MCLVRAVCWCMASRWRAQESWLFSSFEYSGRNFDADMKTLADDPVIRKWWKETDPCQIPLPAAAKAGEIWTPVQEIYRLK